MRIFVLIFLTVCPMAIKPVCQFNPTFQPLTWCFVSQTKENLSISFNYIRVTLVSHIPISPNFLFRKIVKTISPDFLFRKIVKSISPDFLFRKIVKSILFMENETEEAIKMQKLKKTNSSPLGNRTCLLHWCLKAWLMRTKLRKWNEMRLSQKKTNVNGNSWCNNVLLARLLRKKYQNKKKT